MANNCPVVTSSDAPGRRVTERDPGSPGGRNSPVQRHASPGPRAYGGEQAMTLREQMTLREKSLDDSPDRAVSPVIGVILMVAITVILAAVIAAVLPGIVDINSTPQATFSMEDAPDEFGGTDGDRAFRLNHENGDDLAFASFEIVVREADTNAEVDRWTGSSADAFENRDLNLTLNGQPYNASSGVVGTGDRLVIRANGSSPSTGLTADTQYRIAIIDKDSGNNIARSTVTLG
jgi:flagellin-like protein